MEKKTPGAAETAHEGEAIGTSDSTNLAALNQNFNIPDLERRELMMAQS